MDDKQIAGLVSRVDTAGASDPQAAHQRHLAPSCGRPAADGLRGPLRRAKSKLNHHPVSISPALLPRGRRRRSPRKWHLHPPRPDLSRPRLAPVRLRPSARDAGWAGAGSSGDRAKRKPRLRAPDRARRPRRSSRRVAPPPHPPNSRAALSCPIPLNTLSLALASGILVLAFPGPAHPLSPVSGHLLFSFISSSSSYGRLLLLLCCRPIS